MIPIKHHSSCCAFVQQAGDVAYRLERGRIKLDGSPITRMQHYATNLTEGLCYWFRSFLYIRDKCFQGRQGQG